MNKRFYLSLVLLLVWPTFAAAAPDDDDDDDDRKVPETAEVVVAARRLDAARAAIEPSLGASSYTLSNETIESRPGSETVALAQVLLQVPGVAQDGSGQLRVRSQGDIQYRINNVIVPDGLSDRRELQRAVRPARRTRHRLARGDQLDRQLFARRGGADAGVQLCARP